MSKTRVQWVCQVCGRVSPRPMGRCPGCGEWNTMTEVAEERAFPTAPPPIRSEPRRLTEVEAEGWNGSPFLCRSFARPGRRAGPRLPDPGRRRTGHREIHAPAPDFRAGRRNPGTAVLYVSGEESVRQIKMRADRLGIRTDGVYVLSETVLEAILHHAERLAPVMMVVDSIQTVTSGDLPSAAGSVTQVREAAARLQWWAKSSGVVVFLVGHVTKEGAIAGPKVLEYIVDTVLYLEGDPFHTYRLLRTTKNRFGATSEVGVFEMREEGLVEVENPSEAFLAERMVHARDPPSP